MKKRATRQVTVVAFPKGGKDGVKQGAVGGARMQRPKLNQFQKDMKYANKQIDAALQYSRGWPVVANIIIDRELIFESGLVEKFLNSCHDNGVKVFLVEEFSKAFHREFNHHNRHYGAWHEHQAHQLFKLVSWVLKDNIRYVNEVESLRALYEAKDTPFPMSLEKRIGNKLENITNKIGFVASDHAPVTSRHKKHGKGKQHLSSDEAAKRKDASKAKRQQALAERTKNRKGKNRVGRF